MIVVRLMGGLGNQMFQYSTAKALALKNNTKLKIDTTFLDDKSGEHEVVTHRDLDLEIFKINLERATKEEVEYFNGKKYNSFFGKIYNRLQLLFRGKKLVIEDRTHFNNFILQLRGDYCIVGAWQNEKYFIDFKDDLKQEFVFKNPIEQISNVLHQQILNTNSVCVNVRRGDYLTSPLYSKTIGALDIKYIRDSMSFIEEKTSNPVFYLFSDDVEWCKRNLNNSSNCVFVDHSHAGNKFANYLQLMTNCKHFIIPNSTFGWWAAWLGEKKDSLILAPKQWTREDYKKMNEVVPSRWVTIENTFESLQV